MYTQCIQQLASPNTHAPQALISQLYLSAVEIVPDI